MFTIVGIDNSFSVFVNRDCNEYNNKRRKERGC